MQKIIITIATFLLILGCVNFGAAQINRTLKTQVADILAQFPTDDIQHSNKLMEEILSLKTEGILQFCDLLVPAGTGDDTQVRYAIESLAIYAGGQKSSVQSNIVEDAILKTLAKTTDKEIKFFLMERLIFCGTDKSVTPLSKYFSDDYLFSPALASITAIGTTKAADTILAAAKGATTDKQPALIEALGKLRHQAAVSFLKKTAKSKSVILRKKSLIALAEIADESTNSTLAKAAKKAAFKQEATNATLAYLHFAQRLTETGNSNMAQEIGYKILENCQASDQLHFRSAAIHLLRDIKGTTFTPDLIKEAKHEDNAYRGSVLAAAANNLTSTEVAQWANVYKDLSPMGKIQLIHMLQKRKESVVYSKCISKALQDKEEAVRIAGIDALAYDKKAKVLPFLIELLNTTESPQERAAIKNVLLQLVNKDDAQSLANSFGKISAEAKIVLIEVLSARKASSQFDVVAGEIKHEAEPITTAAYSALPSLATSNNLSSLLKLLNKARQEQNIANVQRAIIKILKKDQGKASASVFKAYEKSSTKERFIPVLPFINNSKSLELITNMLESGNNDQKMAALDALSQWSGIEAIPYLFEWTGKSNKESIRKKAFKYYLDQVASSAYPDDQKLLLVKKLMPRCKNIGEQKQIISQAQKIKTFLSLVYVAEYLDNDALASNAAYAAIRIALPSPGIANGLSGDIVRGILKKSMDKLTGPDSEYDRIDVREYLGKMSREKGYVSMFNGKDLSGWQGLVENPIARSKMTAKELSEKQAAADEIMRKEWIIDNGDILFIGDGYKNLCSIKKYADFEMLVDWKIGNKGDSGIYLRGTPQVQIWDTSRVEVGAQVGSGGLYNNQKNERIPLKVADNPINDWNTFHIKMVGERVTVYLNGELVVDNVTLENYWDRSLSIFPKEAIELQAHGENTRFRNIYVREIESGDFLLDEQERKEGFKSLFNGKDLDQWIGNKKDYLVENGELVVRPDQGGHGNLYTTEEYSDFIFRFEFKLTPGGNNGLGIHTPLEGDAAYVGKELQILDNTAPVYANLEPYQYHGSVYGIIPAKRGHLNPVGEWNYEEVIVKGDDIKITLNGTVIVDGNMKEASKNGTIDGQDHPGLKRNNGHIGFLGHGSVLWFRNIRIKELN